MEEMNVGQKFKNMYFLAQVCAFVYGCILFVLGNFFSFSVSGRQADCDVIGLVKEAKEEMQERVARLRTCQFASS